MQTRSILLAASFFVACILAGGLTAYVAAREGAAQGVADAIDRAQAGADARADEHASEVARRMAAVIRGALADVDDHAAAIDEALTTDVGLIEGWGLASEPFPGLDVAAPPEPSDAPRRSEPRPPPVFHPAERPVEVGSARVSVVRAVVDTARVRLLFDPADAGWRLSTEPCTMVEIEVVNTDTTRRLPYLPMMHGLGEGLALADEHGNSYSVRHFGIGAFIRGEARPDPIYPGRAVSDVAVFERPVDAATTLYLTLPGDRLGLDEEIRFAIPAWMIVRPEQPAR